jgi:hypothetical protein
VTDLRPSIESALRAFGVSAVVTPPDEPAVNTRAVWLASSTAEVPGGGPRRAEPKRVLVLPLDGLPEVPRHTIVTLPDYAGADTTDWLIDSAEKVDFDHYRCLVVPKP